MMRRGAAALLLAAVAVPLAWSVGGALMAGWNAAAWQALATDPQTLQALAMGLWTGLASTALAVAASAWLLSHSFTQPVWRRLVCWLSPLLAVPHAAFAIGLVALLSPSGWVLRALSPWATGFDAPPPWPTTQDPWGLGLIAALALKEIPFLLWVALAHLQRPDVARRLHQELRLAHSMGYGAQAAWWRVAWPQLWPRLGAPMLAVLAYSLTVVDMALVIGPTTPPTLAVLTWQWLQDADPATNAQGAAAAWALATVLGLCTALAWKLSQAPWWRHRWTRGVAPQNHSAQGRLPSAWQGPTGLHVLAGLYTAVLLALLVGSVWGHWPFPVLWPQSLSWAAWHSVLASSHTLWTTVWLALASSFAALVWTLAWLEWAPLRWQARARQLLYLPLVLPGVLWVVGLHRLSLAWGLDTQGAGLWLAHTLASLPYVLLALSGPYAGFDGRLRQIAATLGHGHWVFLLRIKWPLLRAALASSFAIGFAVSVAQYLPTLYVGAGRFATVTTEAVNLAAGGQRSLTAAYAWLQWLLPVLVFALAARLGRPRQWHGVSHRGHNRPLP
ncbi:MAG: ABC transporter permease [Rhodoferax sp.]|nr:ABC transporter permease [Rhodoferax sp.]MDP3653027.1 ABC transporter permease [Rhodoferax sp.]